MPCDSIAVLSAQVDSAVIREMLRSEQGLRALTSWLSTRYGLKAVVGARSPQWGVRIVMQPYAIDLITGSEIQLSNMYASVDPALEPMLKEITAFCTRLGGALLQERVKQTLARRYPILQDQAAANGARVLTVEM